MSNCKILHEESVFFFYSSKNQLMIYLHQQLVRRSLNKPLSLEVFFFKIKISRIFSESWRFICKDKDHLFYILIDSWSLNLLIFFRSDFDIEKLTLIYWCIFLKDKFWEILNPKIIISNNNSKEIGGVIFRKS